jgi:hypothetical protein
MEEQERIVRQVLEGQPDHIPSANQPCVSVSHAPFGLEPPLPEPRVREGEALTTMVVLPILDANRASVLEHRAGPLHPVRNAREQFRQVERRVGVMPHPEQEHLPVPLVHMADRALGEVGR